MISTVNVSGMIGLSLYKFKTHTHTPMLLYDLNSRVAENNKTRSSHASTVDHLRRRSKCMVFI